MTKHLTYHKNYTEFGETYQLVLPLSLEGLIPDDDSCLLYTSGSITLSQVKLLQDVRSTHWAVMQKQPDFPVLTQRKYSSGYTQTWDSWQLLQVLYYQLSLIHI